jgi:ribosomal protein S27AE
MESMSTAPVEAAALATATALPMTATGEDILTLAGDRARIACYLGESSFAAGRCARCGGATWQHQARDICGGCGHSTQYEAPEVKWWPSN